MILQVNHSLEWQPFTQQPWPCWGLSKLAFYEPLLHVKDVSCLPPAPTHSHALSQFVLLEEWSPEILALWQKLRSPLTSSNGMVTFWMTVPLKGTLLKSTLASVLSKCYIHLCFFHCQFQFLLKNVKDMSIKVNQACIGTILKFTFNYILINSLPAIACVRNILNS